MIIGICGYGYTGSGALFDFLSEFSGVKVLNGSKGIIKNEFTLSYAPDGLEDLEYNLVTNPSKGVRCDIAIYRFKQLLMAMERSYNRFTNGQFRELTNSYLDSLVQVKWNAYRIFEYERDSSKRIEYYMRNFLRIFLKKRGIDMDCYPPRERYLSILPEDFTQKTKNYISTILSFNEPYNCLLLDQPFSANNPRNSMKFFDEPKCIFVDRDPRDLYIMLKYHYGTQGKFIPTDTVENFISYYRNTRNKTLYSEFGNDILCIRFEEMIYEYEEFSKRIKDFLGEKIGVQEKKKQLFKPDYSIKNTYVYNNYPNEVENIRKIEQSLTEWLYPFESKNAKCYSGSLKEFTLL